MESIKTKPIDDGIERRGYVRERILRVLLNNPDGKMTKYRIVKMSGANISWVIETLRNLEKMNLVKGTKVINYRGIVNIWKDWKIKPKSREYMVKDPLELLSKTKLKYALTTYSAENLVQSYLFPSRVDFYIDSKDLKEWHNILSKKGLVGKGNVRILMTDNHVFYNSLVKKGLTLVSVPQLIVDLLVEGAVAAEAAEMLIEKEEKNTVRRI
ncbi:MAG: hypothetical protein ACREBI_11600 [Nitrosotalea sp.]